MIANLGYNLNLLNSDLLVVHLVVVIGMPKTPEVPALFVLRSQHLVALDLVLPVMLHDLVQGLVAVDVVRPDAFLQVLVLVRSESKELVFSLQRDLALNVLQLFKSERSFGPNARE